MLPRLTVFDRVWALSYHVDLTRVLQYVYVGGLAFISWLVGDRKVANRYLWERGLSHYWEGSAWVAGEAPVKPCVSPLQPRWVNLISRSFVYKMVLSIVSDHPDQYMPTDVSSRLCGECHLETFGEWQESHHAQDDLACSRCHNQHTTELRVGSSQELCQTCHEDEAKFFALTAHAGEGLLCTDCHLQVGDSPIGEGHGIREHTFDVDLDTCNLCHEGDMHADFDSRQAMTTKDNVACYRTDVERVTVTKEEPVSQTPPAPSPIVYALPAGFGLIFGILVAPWAEGIIRRRNGGK